MLDVKSSYVSLPIKYIIIFSQFVKYSHDHWLSKFFLVFAIIMSI